MPKINHDKAERHERQAYPGRLRARTEGCVETKLSEAGGLTQVAVAELELAPGASTGLYHWREGEDEFVFVLEGEVVMVEGADEQELRAGDCATFKAGVRVAHTFENRSGATARLLEVGSRARAMENARYPGYDLVCRRVGDAVAFYSRAGNPVRSDAEVARISGDPEDLKPSSPLDID